MDALNLALEYNRNREVIYQHVHGDKETFHLAFRKTETPVAMPEKGVRHEHGVHFQHDFEGNLLFRHRSLAKWKLFGKNPRIPGFQFEEECLGYLDELREKWDFRFPELTRYRADEASDDKRQEAEDLKKGEWWGRISGAV
ncbi:MAG: hypothetical protein LR011_02025 [Verrucomicrobia bacterium]|nr:hypothetical protein [Verrucomicrobiota bacterium]